MTGYIYKITSPSNKSYIGQTAYLVRRINQYRNFQWRNYDSRIYNSLRKHGFESHKFEILSEIEIDDINLLRLTLDELEVFFIEVYDTFNNGLNSTTGGTYGSFCEDSFKKEKQKHEG